MLLGCLLVVNLSSGQGHLDQVEGRVLQAARWDVGHRVGARPDLEAVGVRLGSLHILLLLVASLDFVDVSGRLGQLLLVSDGSDARLWKLCSRHGRGWCDGGAVYVELLG